MHQSGMILITILNFTLYEPAICTTYPDYVPQFYGITYKK